MEGMVWEIERASARDFDVEVYEEEGEVDITGSIDIAVIVGDVIRSITIRISETKDLRKWED